MNFQSHSDIIQLSFMCIEIGEGKVLLPTGIAIQANNITVKGAGMDKTVIKPEDPDGYLNNIYV